MFYGHTQEVLIMQVSKIIINPMGENCYIIKDNGISAIVDPGGEEEAILKQTAGTEVKYILLTHGHFDHILAVAALKRKTGASVVISEEDAPMLSNEKLNLAKRFGASYEKTEADIKVTDGDTIKIGNAIFTVLATPGHTGGSVCYLAEGFLFSGDTLFKGTIGNFEYENKNTMKSSILKLMDLPDNTRVFPGHEDETTVGFERRNNPYTQTGWE